MDAAPLSYLFGHPNLIGVTLLRPLWLLGLLVLSLFFLRRHPAGWWPTTLRVAATVLVVLVLAGIRLTVPLSDKRLSLAVVVDTSESIDATGHAWAVRYVDELTRSLAPDDEIAVITFAQDVRIVKAPGPAAPLRELPAPAVRTATDLGRAIDTAVALLPADGNRRVILVSDGNETRGDSRRRTTALRESGIRIDAVVPPHDTAPDVAVDRVLTSPVVASGRTVPVRVFTHNSGKARAAVFKLMFDGVLVDSAAVELPAGRSSIEIPYTHDELGSHRLRAVLELDEDAFPGNNYRDVSVMVSGQPRVLLATTREHSVLSRVLERKGVTVDVRAPERLPTAAADFLRYQGVILEDVNATHVSVAALDALRDYVHEFGGGLIVAGGAATFGDERLRRTALRQLLPVTLEPHRPSRTQREPMALFLVIDRSNSMGYNSRVGTLRDGEKLRYAKEAALTVIRQLKDYDLVGVIAFDSQPWEVAPLRPLRDNRTQLEQDIPRLVENGGTDFFDALVSARRQLADSRVNRRHIVLLTDGDTNRAEMGDYERLLGDVVQSRISITTIRIGDDTVNLKLLRSISERTGGEFHHVEHAETLPDLMLRDTTRALEPTVAQQEQYFPRVGERSQVLRGIGAKSIPPLVDYAYARTKDDADVLLHVPRPDRKDPLLAVWQYGLGRVAAFTASPADDAEPWLGWEEFTKLWSQLTRWTVRDQNPIDYAADVRRRDGQLELVVRTFDPTPDDGVLLARLKIGERVEDVPLLAERPREFVGRLPAIPGGHYPLTLTKRAPRRDVSQRTQLIHIPAEEDEPQEEQWPEGPNLPLLTQLTAGTGGVLNPGVRELLEQQPGARRLHYPLDHVLIPLALLIFLGDVAVRRLSASTRTR